MENEQRPTRGRLSKVDLLPDSIREQLHQMLREKRHTQEEIREAINALIDEHNLPEEMQLSRTGLNRYAIRMEKSRGQNPRLPRNGRSLGGKAGFRADVRRRQAADGVCKNAGL